MIARPKVSAFVPCYNYARYVGASIDSLLGQTLGDALQIVVVDDASTDGSWDVIGRYADDPRVTAIRHPKNLGHLATYEDAMAHCSGEYIVAVSADDVVADRDALRLQAELLDRSPRLGFVYTDLRVIDASGRTIGIHSYGRPREERGRAMFERLYVHGNLIPHPGTMVRRTALDQVGTYDPRFFHNADWDLWLRITTRFDVGHLAAPLHGYRIHGSNMHIVPDYSDHLELRGMVRQKADGYAGDWVSPPLRRRADAVGLAQRAQIYLRARRFGRGISDLGAAIATDARVLGTEAGRTALLLAIAYPVLAPATRAYRSIRALVGR